MRRSNEVSLKDAIEQLMRQYRIDDRYRLENVKTNWENIVGKGIAQRTEKLYIKNKTLFLQVQSSVIKQELMMMKTQLIARVNEEAGKEICTGLVVL
jgi:predicted nucleic acid-binding Zn ribbon protein